MSLLLHLLSQKDMLGLEMVGLVLLSGERLFDGKTQIP